MRPVEDEWQALDAAQRPAVAAVGARYVDTRDWFCVAGGCPGVVVQGTGFLAKVGPDVAVPVRGPRAREGVWSAG